MDKAEMVFGIADLGFSGFAFFPSSNGVGKDDSDVGLDGAVAGTTFTSGTMGHFTLIHEIGHALGLAHPDLPAGEHDRQHTVMSYNRHPAAQVEPSGYMTYDIAALQHLYGANQGAAGDDVYDFAMLGDRVQTIWDAAGRDAIDLSASPYGVDVDLNPGAFSTISATGRDNLGIAYGVRLEDVTGSAFGDRLTGNAFENVIAGGAGDDVMTGGASSDVFVFGAGWGADQITDFETGIDIIKFSNASFAFSDMSISDFELGVALEYQGDTILLSGTFHVQESDLVFA